MISFIQVYPLNEQKHLVGCSKALGFHDYVSDTPKPSEAYKGNIFDLKGIVHFSLPAVTQDMQSSMATR